MYAGQVMYDSLQHLDDYEDVSLLKHHTDSPEEQEKVGFINECIEERK